MPSILVKCPSCQSELVYRHGKARSGLQRYRCRDCQHCFQREYLYEANKPGVTDKITDMAMNGSGVRDTGRVKLTPPTVSPSPSTKSATKPA